MSSRQTILYTLFIFFLVLMLVALGWWIRTSMDLDTKKKQLDWLDDRKVMLNQQLNGTLQNPMLGVKNQIEDPTEGLDKKYKDLIESRKLLQSSNDAGSPGVEERRKEFEALDPELKKVWEETGAPSWKAVFEGWEKQDKDIKDALERLKKQRDEREEKESAAEKDLTKETENKETEGRKITQERTKMEDELNSVRLEHEETQQKVTEVSRQLSKVRDVVPQGKIIETDPRMKTAVIDLGANQGVRKGQMFNIYDGSRRQTTLKGLLQVVDAEPFSSRCVLLQFNREMRVDPQTNWVPTNPRFQYSPYSASGPDEQDAQELVIPKTKQDRVEALRIEKEKAARDQGAEITEKQGENVRGSLPPSDLTPGMNPIQAGDWIFNADFVPIVSDKEFRNQMREELIAMRKVNVGPLAFYITDTVRADRKEYLRRLAQRNGCRVVDVMSPDVSFVVTNVGNTDIEALDQRLASTKGKEDVKEDVKQLRTLRAALEDGRKYGAEFIQEDQMEQFFDQRQRKQELLKGKVNQPGRRVFLIAGKTKERTPEALGHYIEDHGGLVAKDIDDKVDYVVVGVDPQKEFIDNIKKRGLKIIREEELAEFFGDTK